MDRRETTRSGAFHEAAHAVHALAQGWAVRHVSVATEERPELRDSCATRRPVYAEWVPVEPAVHLLAGERAAWWACRGEPMPERSFEEFRLGAEAELGMDEGRSGEPPGNDAGVMLYLRRLADLGVENGPNP